MPITQDRLHKLLQAAEAYRDALEFVKEATHNAAKRVRSGQPPKDVFYDLAVVIDSAGPREPVATEVTLRIERHEYKSTHLRNKRVAEWQRQQRRAAGVPERSGARVESTEPLAVIAAQGVKVKPVKEADLEGLDEDTLREIREMQGLGDGATAQPQRTPQLSGATAKPTAAVEWDDPLNDPARLDQEIELAMSPSPHAARFPTGSSRTVYCECGWKGSYEAWAEGHKPEAESQASTVEGNGGEPNSEG